MRLIQICSACGLTLACSGTVNNYYINATGGDGTTASGGVGATGGSGATVTASGGVFAVGGTASSTGLSTTTGGVRNTGGSPGLGGTTATGGATATAGQGGLVGSGGTSVVAANGMVPLTQDVFNQITSAACAGLSSQAENVPVLLDFVVDTSGSMADASANSSGQSKWTVTNQVLQTAFNAFPATTAVGLLLWPNMNTVPNHNDITGGPVLPTSSCVNVSAMVPVAALGTAGSTQRNLLSAALTNGSPRGGTPMADAYSYAVGGIASRGFVGPQYTVLITDGQPTIQLGCMGTGEESHPLSFQPVADSIASAFALSNVKTFIVGLPGSEHQSSTMADGRADLSAAARTGGTAPAGCNDGGPNYCHFDLTGVANFATGFTSALQNITKQALSCDFAIPNLASGQKLDPTKLNVIYRINGSSALADMRLVAPTDSSCPQGNGWYLDPNDPANQHIMLCANTCDVVHKDAGAVLDMRDGCQTVVVIN